MTRPRLWLAAGLAAALGAGDASAQTSVPPSAQDFAMAATQSDQYEIAAAQDAIVQSQDPQIQAFAQTMIDDHTRTRERLRQAATAAGLELPPPAMSSDQAAMLSGLQALRGADFDQAYAKQQVLAHTQALAVEQSYAQGGADPILRAAAEATVSMIRRHLDMARQIRDSLGGS